MEMQNHIFSVSELNSVIREVLESSFYSIQLEGEISNFRPAASGHWYFSLKDRDSTISAVMFKGSTYGLTFRPSDGLKVKVTGKLTLYSQRGTYQIVCNSMSKFGEGDILQMLEERKKRLAALGYFDISTKKPIPRIPKKIGIVTSSTGAALQDILKVLKRRHTLSEILILPSLVQGNTASKTITKQIVKANRESLCDLLIVARGGGSIEDLLPFSEEDVVKAIYESQIPIITGIGHEIDTSLSDYAADIRAATPSAAAEIATDGSEQLFVKIENIKESLTYSISNRIDIVRNQISKFDKVSANRILGSKIENYYLTLDNLKNDMQYNIVSKIEKSKSVLEREKNNIEGISPYALFDKGYAWVTKNNKSIMNQNIKSADRLEIKYKGGKITTVVEDNNEL